MNLSFALRVAALVLFIIAALFGFQVFHDTNSVWEGLVASGLGCWVSSTFTA